MRTKTELSRDIQTLVRFIRIYCDNKHLSRNKSQWRLSGAEVGGDRAEGAQLCQECHELLDYSVTRRKLCPLDPKPMCKRCRTQCYSKDYSLKIREVMKFSGIYLIRHGRLDLIFHYLL